MIIGCDFHTRYQQIAMMDEATGELTGRRLAHCVREIPYSETFPIELRSSAARLELMFEEGVELSAPLLRHSKLSKESFPS
jgi:hypothetical protein